MIKQQDWFQTVSQKSLEKLILDRIIHTGESYILNMLIIKKINEEYFEDSLYRSVFIYIKNQFNENGTIPTDSAIEWMFQWYIVSPITDSVTSAMDELIYRWTVKKARDLNNKIIWTINKGDQPLHLIRELQELYTQPRWVKEEGYFVSKSEKFGSDLEKRIQNEEDFTWIKVWLKYIDKDFW